MTLDSGLDKSFESFESLEALRLWMRLKSAATCKQASAQERQC
jgi:hypothetical protein